MVVRFIAASVVAAVLLAATAGNAAPWGSPCKTAAECDPVGSFGGQCVDGYCCDAVCDGPCLTCKGSDPGHCDTMPAGPSPKCPKDVACERYGCDGTRSACVATLAADGAPCSSGVCTSGVWAGAVCKANAARTSSECTPGASVTCAEYACGVTGCTKAPCATNEDCASDFECAPTKTCVKRAFRCAPDGASSISADDQTIDCRPFKCGDDGRCRGVCTKTSDCAAGSTCVIESGKCESQGAEQDVGGCTLAPPSRACFGSSSLAVAVALWAFARRRARSRVTAACVLATMAAGCSSSSFDVVDDDRSDTGNSDSGGSSLDTGGEGPGDSTLIDAPIGDALSEASPDAATEVVFPAAGDIWTGTPNKLLLVGDGVKGTRTFSGGQARCIGVLDICGNADTPSCVGTTSSQRLIRLSVDGTGVWEKRIYPADRLVPISCTLPKTLAAGAHVLEWRVVELFACAGDPSACGYHLLPDGRTKIRFE